MSVHRVVKFPAADHLVVVFPSPDRRVMGFPKPDHRVVRFPPAPVPGPIRAGASGAGTVMLQWHQTQTIQASASGVGVVFASVRGPAVQAAASGVGVAAAAVTPVLTITAGASGAGAAAADVGLVQFLTAAASGVGAASIAVGQAYSLAANASGVGSAGAQVRPVFTVHAGASGAGMAAAEVLSGPFQTPMGVTLSADYTGPHGTWFNPAGWVVRAGYPDTEIVNNELELPGPADYLVTSSIQHGYNYYDFGVRVRAGAQVLATITANASETHDLVNAPITHPGGPLTIEVWTEQNFSDNEVILAGSWVEIDLP